MKYWYFFLPGIVFLLLPVIYGCFHERSARRRVAYSEYRDMHNRCRRVLEMKTADPVYSYIMAYKAVYESRKQILDEAARECYRRDMDMLWDHLRSIETENWRKRAMPHLRAFADCYNQLRRGAFQPQLAQQIRKKCISEWQDYYGVSLDRYYTRITPRRFFKEEMGEDYDECMDEHYRLERKLNRFISDVKK